MSGIGAAETLRLTLAVWRPGCWVLDVTSQVDIGCLGDAIYTHEDGRASTHYTLHSDEQAAIEQGLSLIRDHRSVNSISEMIHGYRHDSASTPGNTTRDLMDEQDGEALTGEA